MKRNAFLCLCLCLCLLFSACGTPSDGSSAPVEEGSEVPPVPEDPNAKAACAYLEELLDAEKETGTVDWLTSERAEAIRDCVKALKTPILTEEDVLRIAERAVAFYFAAWRGGTTLYLPACGVMASFEKEGGGAIPDLGVYGYTQVVAYMVYLFTPPDYVFRESDVGREISSDAPEGWPGFYLALAEAGSTPLEAMETLSHGVKGLTLQLSELAKGEYPLDLRFCEGLTLLRGNGEKRPFALLDLALSGDVSLPEAFFDYAERFVGNWIDHFSMFPQWEMEYYQMTDEAWEQLHKVSDSEWVQVLVPLAPETAEQLRKMVQLFPAPILTKQTVSEMTIGVYGMEPHFYLILLPGVNGGKDLLLPAYGDGTELRYWLMMYLLDLFTPPGYRDTDLFDRPGTYFELADEETCYALIVKGHELYLTDGEGNLASLYDVVEGGQAE